MKNIVRKELVIGACVIIALAVLFFGIEYLKGVSIFKPSNYYYAVYNDVAGLTPSAPVTVNGFKVGQVDNVELMYDRPDCVLVSFSLDKELKLPQGSTAVIESSLLGTASVVLKLTSEHGYYNPGDTISAKTDAGMLGTVTEEILPGVTDIVPKIDTLITGVNNLVGNPALLAAINNIEASTAALQQTMRNINAATSGLPKIMSDVKDVTSSINTISTDLTTLSQSLANAPIDSVINNLTQVSNDLANLTGKLDDPNNSVGQLLNNTTLYDNITSVTANLDSLFVDIKKNPKRYINIKLL